MTVFRRYLKDGSFALITEGEARRLKMRRKHLGEGKFALITEDEARREYGVRWLSDTYPIYPESMPEGRRALLDRMQSGGPGSEIDKLFPLPGRRGMGDENHD